MNPNQNTQSNSRSVIQVGFTAIIFLLLTLTAMWLSNVYSNEQHLHGLVDVQNKRQLIFTMRDAAYGRANSLLRMAALDDPFDRDDEYLRFKELAGEFIKARRMLLLTTMDKDELKNWDKIKTHIANSAIKQSIAVELILEEKQEEAHEALNEVMDLQKIVMRGMTEMLNAARDQVNNEVELASEKNQTAFVLISSLVIVSLIISFFIARFVIFRTSKAEATNLRQTQRISTLYNIHSRETLSLDDEINETLKRGCELLGLDIGKVCHIDQVNNTNTFIYTYAPEFPEVVPGNKISLNNTFCSIVILEDEPIALHHIGKSKYKDHACYDFSGLETYIAAPIIIGGKKYGTINFSSPTPRDEPFDESDKDLLKMVASWVGVTFQRLQVEKDLEIAKDVAENASKAKSAFVANMSHEIRTPLTAIIGFSERLLNRNQNIEQREEATRTIIRNSTHLNQIVNDILDLSKIEAGQLEIERKNISLTQILTELDSLTGMQAREAGLEFVINYNFPIPKIIETDPVRLKQILINLCGNAVKFTQQGSITTDISYDAVTNQVKFSVRDTGIGMTSEEMHKIFKPFSQADISTTRKFGGTGLGLCISMQLAEKLGGSITCTSEKKKGSQFCFTINAGEIDKIKLINTIDDSPSRASNETISNKPAPLKGRILLAEDSPDNQQLVSHYVSETGASLTIVENGQLAVEEILVNDYDLVLMDVQMPVMDGLEATNWLRTLGYKKPIVMLTANAMKEDHKRSKIVGADDYLVKPVDLSKFYHVLNKYLEPALPYTPDIKQADHDKKQTKDITANPRFKELVLRFVNKLPEMLEEINQATSNHEWTRVKAVSHNLKGMGGSFGYNEITDVAGAINKKITDNDLDGIVDIISRLNIVCNNCITENVSNNPQIINKS